MTEKALLLTGGGLPPAAQNIGKVLAFFGVPSSVQTLADFVTTDRCSADASKTSRVFVSSETFLDLVSQLKRAPELIRGWKESVHSVFVYGGDRTVLQKLMTLLGHEEAVIVNTLWRGSLSFL
ncbi:MAG: hypothetical protein DME32_17985, partial [Verrucomicrobia bacterium]